MKPNSRVTPADLEAGIAAAENEGVLNPTASQVLAIHRAMLADPKPGMKPNDAMIARMEAYVSKFPDDRDMNAATIDGWESPTIGDLRTILAMLAADQEPDVDAMPPNIVEEGERLANDTPRMASGNYLWTDLVGAVQTAIADERARHVR